MPEYEVVKTVQVMEVQTMEDLQQTQYAQVFGTEEVDPGDPLTVAQDLSAAGYEVKGMMVIPILYQSAQMLCTMWQREVPEAP